MATSKTPPPLRNYAQMARVVRDDQKSRFSPSVPYQLAKAYGDYRPSATETRIRSLDEIGMNTRPAGQLQKPATDNYYTLRESTIIYHKLDEGQQKYFDGVSPNTVPTRRDALPGTKTRTYLNSDAPSEKITVGAREHDDTSHHLLNNNDSNNGGSSTTYEYSGVKNKPNPKEKVVILRKSSSDIDVSFVHEKPGKKKTRLPAVYHHSLEGTADTSLEFSLNF